MDKYYEDYDDFPVNQKKHTTRIKMYGSVVQKNRQNSDNHSVPSGAYADAQILPTAIKSA